MRRKSLFTKRRQAQRYRERHIQAAFGRVFDRWPMEQGLTLAQGVAEEIDRAGFRIIRKSKAELHAVALTINAAIDAEAAEALGLVAAAGAL